ncbi:lipoyl(octanoyl) transferase LipB [Pajaroellobacter abortibovis]|uniref:Octanoyltransferase n=1 Tax=Pajaroellobacter abortibovis TaxID=1882918 RepID=A0A1L6MXG3_9BACT|nr:lipoyl(octanoyl) transferase LipB [Pajaroellobacter abortibovis]APS00263.1 lipoyl(octanoyl) transferase [Pajaroellobacter abortibovis]
MRSIDAHWLGRMPYQKAHSLQLALVNARKQGLIENTLLLLEHEPVITLGRGADPAHVRISDEMRACLGVERYETGRGGGVTYHGPGQLIAYPIFDLKPNHCDVRQYVQNLAKVMVLLAGHYGICAKSLQEPKRIGVWIDRNSPFEWGQMQAYEHRLAKLGSIGIRLSHWITMHGFSFNVAPDLQAFDWIVPCGISNLDVTSLANVGISTPSLECLAEISLPCFEQVFEAPVRYADVLETQALYQHVLPSEEAEVGL